MMQMSHIAICGSGLAACLTAMALRQALPVSVQISVIEDAGDAENGLFYGTVTSPSFYNFLLALGLSEPELLQNTQATFSLGTQYSNWGKQKCEWTQCFFVALPSFENVGLHHALARLKKTPSSDIDISPYILSSVMAEQGVFAHPPEEGDTPLKNIEYGYHVLTEKLVQLASRIMAGLNIQRIDSKLDSIERDGQLISSLMLSNGEHIQADLYINASGQDGLLSSYTDWLSHDNKSLSATQTRVQTGIVDGVCRKVVGHKDGWTEISPLQGVNVETKFDFIPSDALGESNTIELGRLPSPWTGNLLSIGQSACALAPITPAPFMLLQKDIERLLELFPIDKNMGVERSEYNRRFIADVEHAQMFTDLFWHDETGSAEDNHNSDYYLRFEQKREQFSERGVLVRYDYEPFNAEDWVQLYLGLGLYPKRYDRLADGLDLSELKAQLEQIKAGNAALVKRIPPHGLYLKKLLEFLEKRHG